jgi:hypothetical protein
MPPVPLSDTVSGLVDELVVMVNVAVSAPFIDGVNVICRSYVPLPTICDGSDELVIAKSDALVPDIVAPEKISGACPVFVIVTVCAAVVDPVVVTPLNVIVEVDNCRSAGVALPELVPVSATTSGLEAASVLNVRVPVLVPFCVGVKPTTMSTVSDGLTVDGTGLVTTL